MASVSTCEVKGLLRIATSNLALEQRCGLLSNYFDFLFFASTEFENGSPAIRGSGMVETNLYDRSAAARRARYYRRVLLRETRLLPAFGLVTCATVVLPSTDRLADYIVD